MYDIWSLKGCKQFSYFTLVLILSKNEKMMLFAILTPYQTYWRICLKQISAVFSKKLENCPFWRHFGSTILGAHGFLKPNVWACWWHENWGKNEKKRSGNSSYVPHTHFFPQIVPLFAHFWGQKIEMSTFFPVIHCSISQWCPLSKKRWSTYNHFYASG